MKIMKDYYVLYLRCDILILADVFQNFTSNSLKNYGLCPSYYLSVPGLSWYAMLKITKSVLELIAIPDIYVLFEKGTRCRIIYISNRYSTGNR